MGTESIQVVSEGNSGAVKGRSALTKPPKPFLLVPFPHQRGNCPLIVATNDGSIVSLPFGPAANEFSSMRFKRQPEEGYRLDAELPSRLPVMQIKFKSTHCNYCVCARPRWERRERTVAISQRRLQNKSELLLLSPKTNFFRIWTDIWNGSDPAEMKGGEKKAQKMIKRISPMTIVSLLPVVCRTVKLL